MPTAAERLCAGFAWRYRASNNEATYAPAWTYSLPIDLAIWVIPTILIDVLGNLVWVYTHRSSDRRCRLKGTHDALAEDHRKNTSKGLAK